MKCPKCGHKFKDKSRVKGGQISRRAITPEQQAAMQAASIAARAAKRQQQELTP